MVREEIFSHILLVNQKEEHQNSFLSTELHQIFIQPVKIIAFLCTVGYLNKKCSGNRTFSEEGQ